MALNVITTKQAEYTYVPVAERNEDSPFTVTFKPLSLTTRARVKDSAITVKDGNGYEINVNKQNLEALRHGLIGWDNISDDKGPIKFRLVGGLADIECLEYLPTEYRTEIGNIILEVSDDPKNAQEILSA